MQSSRLFCAGLVVVSLSLLACSSSDFASPAPVQQHTPTYTTQDRDIHELGATVTDKPLIAESERRPIGSDACQMLYEVGQADIRTEDVAFHSIYAYPGEGVWLRVYGYGRMASGSTLSHVEIDLYISRDYDKYAGEIVFTNDANERLGVTYEGQMRVPHGSAIPTQLEFTGIAAKGELVPNGMTLMQGKTLIDLTHLGDIANRGGFAVQTKLEFCPLDS